ncbi:threonine synthase [Cohnella zeiphila]|uniref:Threonine synthase n=1 Tax=Cohnella zeiphila TaxID=2761120 RepID=A0A7X0SGM0_9BACL|nr:threonine synthase [Cohnella zeiphila]MBB6729612.1 threonine synthase [Cohnella zeiphila]
MKGEISIFIGFECTQCGRRHPPGLVYQCPECGGSLDARYDYERFRQTVSIRDWIGRKERGIWKYRELLPVRARREPITLGEGSTPLIKSHSILKNLNIENFWIKNETVNPTLSFKDRAQSVAVNAAKDLGLGSVVCASTGNTGVAAAAYAARAGLPCSVYVPAGTPDEKLRIIRAFGAELRIVEGNYGDAYAEAGGESVRRGAFNLTSTYLNPYSIEGNKTVAYEIFAELGGVPDWIAIPVGAGPLLDACYKGFRELKAAGLAGSLPRMVGVQAQGCAPIVRAFENEDDQVRPWDAPRTVASGIADPLTTYPADGARTLRTIRESGGAAVAIGEEEIVRFRERLAAEEGLLVETSAATAVAAVSRLRERGLLQEGQSIVSVVTGHGVKDLTATTI